MSTSNELAASLRAWRERRTPQMAGLPAKSGRRTSGLRREELAVLACVSVDYVVRLEQGRASAPSVQVCTALAQALQLSDAEQEHLFRLAGHTTESGTMSRLVPTSIRRLVERTEERPIAVFDAMWNLLMWNPLWAALMGDPTSLREEDRNLLWLHFTEASDCHLYGPESSDVLDESLVGDLRRSAGRYPEDVPLRQLVSRLSAVNPQFREIWSRHSVHEHGPAIKRVVHSVVGSMELDCDILTTQRQDLRIMMYTAEPATESDGKLALLGALGTQSMVSDPAALSR